MVWLHLVTPLPIRVSGFSTCRLRLTLFLFWDLSNRIGPQARRRNFLGRFYGGRNEISCMLCCKRVMSTREPVNSTSKFSSAGTCKKYRCIIDSGTASRRKIMKKIWLTEYSIRVSPCMHEMQRGTRLACMVVWAGQLSQRSCWQPNMAEWRRDARPSGPSAGHKPLCVSNGHHVCSAKANPHH